MNVEAVADLIRWEHGPKGSTPKLPPTVPAEMLEFVRENRSAVLKAACDRYMRCPPKDAYWNPQSPPRLSVETERVIAYASNQTNEVKEWIETRSKEVGMLQASVDLISWQHASRAKPVLFVLSLD